MRALECTAPGALKLTARPTPEPAAGEALVRIRRVGICGTDFHIFAGNQPFVSYPRIMGHELAGEIVDAPRDSGLSPGDHVCVAPYIACGVCVACRRSKPNCCMNIAVLGVHRDGGLAEYLSAPTQNILPANGLGLDALAMTEFLAIGRHAVRRANVEAGQRVLVVGAGPIGLGVALFARLQGAEVVAMDNRAERLAFCRDQLGAAHTLSPSDTAYEALGALSHGEFFDAVFDATGNRKAMEQGFRYVAHGGAYVLVSVVQGDITFTDAEFHKRETTLLGSRNATIADFLEVIDAMRAGHVPLRALNTHRASLEDLPQMLPQWSTPQSGVIKALVEL